MIALTVNGTPRQLDVPPDMPLLWAVRESLGLTGTKYGCGMALCGACTVHVDGAPVRACVTPVSAVAGKQVTAQLEAVELAGQRATALALVFSELLSNALEHGGEHVSIALESDGAEITLVVRDDGTGFRNAVDGTGMSIVRALVRDELGGSLSLTDADGLHAEVRFPAYQSQ